MMLLMNPPDEVKREKKMDKEALYRRKKKGTWVKGKVI